MPTIGRSGIQIWSTVMASCRSGDRRLTICALVVIVLGAAVSASAQTALAGVVFDPEDAVVPNAPVVIVNEKTGHRLSDIATPFGHYYIPDVPPGFYTVSVEVRDGGTLLKFTEPHVEVHEGYVKGFDIHMWVATEVSVTVPGNTTVESTAAIVTSIDGTTRFTREAIDAMPLINGRTLQSMLSMVPEIAFTENLGNPSQFAAGGQRRRSNGFAIDGVSGDVGVTVISLPIDAEASSGVLPAFSTMGGTQTIVPIGAISEIEVRTTNASPEYARGPGAQTSVVTRAGTNRFTASGHSDFRPSSLAAADWFANAGLSPQRTVSLWDAGASVGGPLFPRRIFYFGTWQHQRINRAIAATMSVPSIATREAADEEMRGFLDAYPRPNGKELSDGLAEFADKIPSPSRLSAFSLRFDANVSPEQRAFVRGNIGRSSGDSLAAGGVLPATASFMQKESTSTATATIGLNSSWTSSSNELRFNASQHRVSVIGQAATYGSARPLESALLVPTGRTGADTQVGLTLFPELGGLVIGGRSGATTNDQIEIADTWSLFRGRHHWSLGIDYRQVTISQPSTDRYRYRFLNLARFLQGRLTSVIAERVSGSRVRIGRWAAFAQDTFRLSPRLSLDYGLRYGVLPPPHSLTDLEPLLIDFESLPEVEARPAGARLWTTSWTDIGPHVGATYRVGWSETYDTHVRAGWRLVFDDRAGFEAVGAFADGPPFVSRRLIGASQFPLSAEILDADFPEPLAADNFADVYSVQANTRSPRTYDWQVRVDQALAGSQRLGLAYVGAAARHLSRRYAYGRRGPDPRVLVSTHDGTSDYHAFVLEYVKSSARGLEGRVSYTWSHAIDVDSGEDRLAFEPPPELASPLLNRASADFDVRHVLYVNASYQLPSPQRAGILGRLSADWRLEGVGILRTGTPVSVIGSRTTPLGVYPFRPDLVTDVPIWIRDDATSSGRRLNPDAFVVPVDVRQGTLGRNTVRAPALHQIDVALSRAIHLGAGIVATVRLDAFNVFNIPSFGPPQAQLTFEGFGRPEKSYADMLGTGTLRGGLTPIQQVGGPRALQFSVRVGY